MATRRRFVNGPLKVANSIVANRLVFHVTFCLISATVKADMKGVLSSQVLTACDRFQFHFTEINGILCDWTL